MSAPSQSIAPARPAVFAVIAAFMLASPALPQVFGIGKPWIRQWTMFSGVGRGIPKGDFIIETHAGMPVRTLTPLAAAGLTRYPVTAPVERFDRYVYHVSDLQRFAAPACADLNADQRLRFAGVVGSWHGFTAPVSAVVCEGAIA